MPVANLPDWSEVGARVALARRTHKLTQADLAERIGVDRSAVARIESGGRQISALELAALARATDLPIDWFIGESVPVVASRRAGDRHDPSIVDVRVDVLARDVVQMLELDLIRPTGRRPELSVPRDVASAEAAAAEVRSHIGLEAGPPPFNLAAAAESLGVFAYSLALEASAADGAYVAISDEFGVALLNGTHASARRRFTLAHEIGHHVFQDAYALDLEATGSSETERLIDAFAVHLLLPHRTLEQRWSELRGGDDSRSAAIVIGAEHRLSWTALCGHLVNLGLLDRDQGDVMREELPHGWEYAELGIDVVEELAAPMVPRSIVRAALRGYRTHRLDVGRTLELLHGTLSEADLPDREPVPLAALAGELRSAQRARRSSLTQGL